MLAHAVKGIPLLQARNKWGFHRKSLRSAPLPCAGRWSAAALCQDTVQDISHRRRRAAPVKGVTFLGAGETPGPQRSRNTAAAGPAQLQPSLHRRSHWRSHRHSPLPAHTAGASRPAKLPDPSEGTGCSALAVSLQLGWRFRARNTAFSFNKSLRSVRAPSLQFLLFRGDWQDWTAQLLQRYTSPAENILLFKDLSPVP